MSLYGLSLRICVLGAISRSYAPFKIGVRRKDILKQVTQKSRHIHGPIKESEEKALNMRLERVFKSLVKDGLIKKENKGHQKTFYFLEKDGFPEFIEYVDEYVGAEAWDKELYEKIFRQKIISRSDYLKLPDYMDMIPITDILNHDLTYEEFRSKIMDLVVEVLEPQIKTQYERMKEADERMAESVSIVRISVS